MLSQNFKKSTATYDLTTFGYKILYFDHPYNLPFCVRPLRCGYPTNVGDLLLGHPPYQLLFWNAITNVKLALDIS